MKTPELTLPGMNNGKLTGAENPLHKHPLTDEGFGFPIHSETQDKGDVIHIANFATVHETRHEDQQGPSPSSNANTRVHLVGHIASLGAIPGGTYDPQLEDLKDDKYEGRYDALFA